jgi:F0F1-type ATP synthase membrane subunit a
MKSAIWRALIETGFIIFLFYSNLLMGEFERSGMGQEKGIAWAVRDVATPMTLAIAVVAALIGYGIVEALRKKSK